jgi:photosystem II stability/assembly factor-like uncharacterized protein
VDFQGLSLVGPDDGWLVAGRYPEGDSFWGGQGYIVHARADVDSFIKDLVRQDTMYDFFDVDFVDAQNGWIVGGCDRDMRAAVLHTSDGGAHWTEQLLPPGTRYLRAVDFADSVNGWACGRNGSVIHTSDGGLNWEAQYCPVDTTLFDIEFAGTQHGLIAGNSLVLYTTDGGAHWTRGLGGVAEQTTPPLQAEALVAVSPARGRVPLRGRALQRSGRVVVRDVFGREVRVLGCGAGDTVTWDGLDGAGRQVGNGLYLAQVRSAGETASARFVYLKE